MNIRIACLGAVGALMANSAAFADARVNVDINPFGWGSPPPVVYESSRYYAPPPVVYSGRGHWGERREGRGRDHDAYRERERHDERGHHEDGDRRR